MIYRYDSGIGQNSNDSTDDCNLPPKSSRTKHYDLFYHHDARSPITTKLISKQQACNFPIPNLIGTHTR
jgi:hypothetical protein